jgi:hypothetical protein
MWLPQSCFCIAACDNYILRFFTVVELFDLEALSNVLMFRTRWFSSLIKHERDVFLSFKDETDKIIDEWRSRVVVFVIKVYSMIKSIEWQAFDEKSYYHLRNLAKKRSLFDILNDVNFDLSHTLNDVNFEFINTDFSSWCRRRRVQKIKRVVLKARQKLI